MPIDILSPSSRETLAAFVTSHPLMAFDFDGVLAPIVAVRERAQLRPVTRELLQQLARRFPCIVVSGRQRADLAPRLEGIPLRMVFGNFGYESGADGPPPPIVAEWVAELRQRFRAEPGVAVEDKVFSVAVHYRHAPYRDHARERIEEVLAGMPDGRMMEGTLAVALVPLDGPNKGSTLQSARVRLGCERAIFLGDDDTDEDAFTSAPPDRLLSVRVGTPERTRASFVLRHQADIDRLLERMLAMSTP